MKIGKDKYLHFSICAIIAIAIMVIFNILDASFSISALASICAAMGTGLGKEYGDKVNPNNKWDWKDVFADFLGTILGILISGTLWLL